MLGVRSNLGAKLGAWLVALAVLHLAGPAAGREPDRYRALVEQATRAFGEGDFARAEQLALEAYALKPDPKLLYNAARAREANGDPSGAIEAYERYLQETPEASDAAIIAGRVKALRSQIAQGVRFEAEQNASAGRRARARAGFQKYLELAPDAADRVRIEARIRELAQAPQPARVQRVEAVSAERANLWPWIVTAGGALVAGGGVVFALESRRTYDHARTAATGEDAARYRDQGDRYTDLANVAFVTGGVLAAAGIAWWVVQPSVPAARGRVAPAVGFGVAPGWVAASGQF